MITRLVLSLVAYGMVLGVSHAADSIDLHYLASKNAESCVLPASMTLEYKVAEVHATPASTDSELAEMIAGSSSVTEVYLAWADQYFFSREQVTIQGTEGPILKSYVRRVASDGASGIEVVEGETLLTTVREFDAASDENAASPSPAFDLRQYIGRAGEVDLRSFLDHYEGLVSWDVIEEGGVYTITGNRADGSTRIILEVDASQGYAMNRVTAYDRDGSVVRHVTVHRVQEETSGIYLPSQINLVRGANTVNFQLTEAKTSVNPEEAYGLNLDGLKNSLTLPYMYHARTGEPTILGLAGGAQ